MTRRSSLEPFPSDDPAWTALYDCFIAACGQQSPATRHALLEALGGDLKLFQHAVYLGDVSISPRIQGDGLHFVVRVHAANGVFEIVSVHIDHLGLDLADVRADAWLADVRGDVNVDVPDDPSGT